MKKRELRQLGLELKNEREIRNIKIEDIADKTKINIKFLKSIEAGDFNFLPTTYVRYFLKSYLQHLGRNAEKYLTNYDVFTQSTKPSFITDKDLLKSNVEKPAPGSWLLIIENIKKIKKRYFSIMVGTAAFIILVATIPLLKEKEEKSSSNNGINTQLATDQNSQLASFSSFRLVKRNLNLNLIAKERTWLQITIDDSTAQEYIFEKGDSAIWNAKEKLLLKIGNSAGVRLYLNGNDLGPLGSEREVVNLLLTKDGIQRNRL